MSFDEAVAFLGLTPPFTAKDARRAYLRLLKVHKPETNPEGFMRLRQAYELVERFGDAFAPADEERAEERPEEAAEPPANASVAVAQARPEPIEEVEEAAPPVDDASLPPWQRPVPEDAKVAAVLLTEWLVRAKSDPDAPPPPMTSALRVLWAMLDRRAFKTAGRLYAAIDEWLVQVGGARGQLAWGMTQGLWEMRKEIPEQLYSPMVRAVATEDPGLAADALRSFAQTAPGLAGSLQRRLAAQSPQLAVVFNAYLMPHAERRLQPAPATRSWASYGWVVVVIGLGLTRALTGGSSSSKSSGAPQYATRGAMLKQVAAKAANDLASAADGASWPELAEHARTLSVSIANEMCVKAHEELAVCRTMVAGSDAYRASFGGLVQQVEAPLLEHCGPAPRGQRTVLPASSAAPPVPSISASATAPASASASIKK